MDAFKRIGVVGDWEHPYLTMDPGFEAEEVKVFGEMYKKGYIYKGLKPVYWCACRSGSRPRRSPGRCARSPCRNPW